MRVSHAASREVFSISIRALTLKSPGATLGRLVGCVWPLVEGTRSDDAMRKAEYGGMGFMVAWVHAVGAGCDDREGITAGRWREDSTGIKTLLVECVCDAMAADSLLQLE